MKKRMIIIGGNRWVIDKLTPKLAVKLLASVNCTDKNVKLRGFCNLKPRQIYIDVNQSREDVTNTQLHEGLHAIIHEIGGPLGLGKLNRLDNEHIISQLTGEILGYLKQVGVVR